MPGLGDENHELANTVPLRMLLGAATALMLLAAAGYLFWGLATGGARGPAGLFLVVLVLGGCAAALFLLEDLSLRQLRGIELAAFGSLGAYLAWNMFATLSQMLQTGDAGAIGDAWNAGLVQFILLIIAYGTLVSNSWQRCAAGVTALAALPVAAAALAVQQAGMTLGQTSGRLALTAGALLVAAILAVLAAYVIGQYLSVAGSTRITLRYELKRRIGLGGMGEVWLAEHNMLARAAAVKLIRTDTLGAKDADRAELVLRRFEREAKATAALRSPNTVEVYDFGHASDGTFYYAMEFLDGFDLRSLVEEHGPVPPARAVYLLRQACESLADAHATGMFHRDIKPANIFACRLGTALDFVKVLDFGLVTSPTLPAAPSDAATDLTIEGEINGTPGYMAPELIQDGGSADARADLYALGCVGYYLLTATPLFEGPPLNVLMAHVQTEPEPPSARVDAIPDDLERVILRCLAKDPDDRYQSATALAEALDATGLGSAWDQAARADWWTAHQPAPRTNAAVILGARP